jgi:hypothetical protein
MINYACPKCSEPLQAAEERLGTNHPCPKCQFQVQVPLAKAKGTVPFLLGAASGAGVMFLTCACCGVLGTFGPLAGISGVNVMGKNANSAFGTVGSSIGATVSSGR